MPQRKHQWEDCDRVWMAKAAGCITFGQGPHIAPICTGCGLNRWYARFYRRIHNRAFPDNQKGMAELFPCEQYRYCMFGAHVPEEKRGNWTEAPGFGQPAEADMPWVEEARAILEGNGQEASHATV